MNTRFWQAALAIARKDLRAEVRSRELVNSMGLFALLSVLIFSFALELDRLARQEAISGVLWVTLVFASILGLNRSMAIEREQGSFDALVLAPIHRSAIFTGKLLANSLFTLLVGLVLLPLMSILYNVSLFQPWILLLLILGISGFSSVGTLLATMTVQTRARESLLPIVMLPVTLPLLIAVVRATTAILNDAPLDDWIAWPQILLVVNLIYLTLCFLLYEFVLES
jgi:heme exporter protein B